MDIWYEATNISRATIDQELSARAEALAEMTRKQPKYSTGSCFEPWEGNPHRFFFFASRGTLYCGSKLISPLVTEHGSPGLFCSLIRPEMLLGRLLNWQTSQVGVKIGFQSISANRKRSIFKKLIDDQQVDIFYPFAHLDKSDRLEVNTPPEGWFISPERAEILGRGEVHFRALSAKIVSESGIKNPVVFDPACSTGQFLAQIKQSHPGAFTIGQDLSGAMCEMARPRIDRVIQGDSITPGVGDGSCDFVFFRFLNAEVVTRARAVALFDRLIQCLKPDGRVILFGHTPVLLSREEMQERGFTVRMSHANLPDQSAVFQYYQLERNQR